MRLDIFGGEVLWEGRPSWQGFYRSQWFSSTGTKPELQPRPEPVNDSVIIRAVSCRRHLLVSLQHTDLAQRPCLAVFVLSILFTCLPRCLSCACSKLSGSTGSQPPRSGPTALPTISTLGRVADVPPEMCDNDIFFLSFFCRSDYNSSQRDSHPRGTLRCAECKSPVRRAQPRPQRGRIARILTCNIQTAARRSRPKHATTHTARSALLLRRPCSHSRPAASRLCFPCCPPLVDALRIPVRRVRPCPCTAIPRRVLRLLGVGFCPCMLCMRGGCIRVRGLCVDRRCAARCSAAVALCVLAPGYSQGRPLQQGRMPSACWRSG